MAKTKFTEADIRAKGYTEDNPPVIFHNRFVGYEIRSRKEIQEMVVNGWAYYTRGRIKVGVFVLHVYKPSPGTVTRWSAKSAGFTMSGNIRGYPQAAWSKDNGWADRENERRKLEKVEQK